MSDALDATVDAYLDGTIDAERAVALARVIRCGGAEAERVRERIAFAGLLGLALDDSEPDGVVRGVEERLAAHADGSAFTRQVAGAIAGRSRMRRRRRAASRPWTAVLAVVALVVAAVGWWAVPRSSATAPACWLAGDGSVVAVGERIDGAQTVAFADGTRVSLAPGARLRIDAIEPAKALHLEQGAITAQVSPQPPTAPLRVATAAARIEVVGTRFTLAVEDVGTRLSLMEGAVRFTEVASGATRLVRAGETALAATIRPTALFPADGLAGWVAQHGRWSNRGGVVRGEAGSDTARLLSVQELGDLDLRCRMRIGGADHAEVQVGDYNWFFTVPAAGSDWIALHLTQRAGALTCTADGAPLTVEAGAGAAPRPGPLGFYVRAGTIEIADAVITLP